MLGSKRSSSSSSSCRRRVVQGGNRNASSAPVPSQSTALACAVRLRSWRSLATDSLLASAFPPGDAGATPVAVHPDSPELAPRCGGSYLGVEEKLCLRKQQPALWKL